MNWKQQWMDEVLSEIPAGGYRGRLEMELRDHLETLCQSLMESGRTRDEARVEALRAMGEPEALRGEYRAAWRRSLPGRLEAAGLCLRTWAKGLAVMLGVHLVISLIAGGMWSMALSLPGDSWDPQIRMIRETAMDYYDSGMGVWLPFVSALTAGAYYLGRKTRTRRRPAGQISGVLSFYWALMAAFDIWWEALDDHVTFWQELIRCLPYRAGYYGATLALCVLLGFLFGRISAGKNRHTAA